MLHNASITQSPAESGPRAFHSHQLLLQPAIKISQPVRIDPKLIQNRRVKMLHGELIPHSFTAQFIGFADAHPAPLMPPPAIHIVNP